MGVWKNPTAWLTATTAVFAAWIAYQQFRTEHHLITVPSCADHNSATATYDEYLAYTLPIGLTADALGKHNHRQGIATPPPPDFVTHV